MEYDRSKLDYVDTVEKIYVLVDKWQDDLMIKRAESTKGGASVFADREGWQVREIDLHRPSLRAIYGGPTLIEALWVEMDRLMEGLMTKQDAEDGGDRWRAQELAWVLAIVEDAYNPDVNRIRAKAMDRWNAQQLADAQEEALAVVKGEANVR